MTINFRANFVYSLVGMLVPLATALVTVPIYIRTVGPERYGMIAIAWLLLGYFGFLDFGLSRASVNALSRLTQASAKERSPVIVTAIYLNLALGLVGVLLMFLIGRVLLIHVFTIPNELRAEVMESFPWVAAMIPVGMLSGVTTGVLESRDRFLVSNTLSSVGSVAGQLVPLQIAIFVSPTLTYVIPAMLLVRLATVMANFVAVAWKEWPLGLFDIQIIWVKRLFGYGAWVSVSSLISPLLDGFDQLLIGVMLGPIATAHYAVSMNLALRSQLVSVSLARTLFPHLSRAEPEEARRLAMQACVGLAYGFGAICGPAILISRVFLDAWVGWEFASTAAPVAEILFAGAWINGIAFIPYSFLQGQGRPDLTAKVHLAEIAPFMAALWLLMQRYGLPGAAWAWTGRVSIDGIVLLALSGCPLSLMWKVIPAFVLIAACWLTAWQEPGVTVSVIAALVAGASFVVMGLTVEPSLRANGLVFLKRYGINGFDHSLGLNTDKQRKP